MAHTTDSSPRCPLLDLLPRELRDEIWSLSLTDETSTTDQNGNQVQWIESKSSIATHHASTPPFNYPALLGTCRQVRIEATEIYYGKTIFLFKAPVNNRNIRFNAPITHKVDAITWLTTLPQTAVPQIKFFGIVEPRPMACTLVSARNTVIYTGMVNRVHEEARSWMSKELAKLGVSPKAVKFLKLEGVRSKEYKIEEADGEDWKETGVLELKEPVVASSGS